MAILEVRDLTEQFKPQAITTEGVVVHHSRDPKVVIPILYFLNKNDFTNFSNIAGPFYGLPEVQYSLTPSNHGNAFTHYGQPAKLVRLSDSDHPIILKQTRQDRLLYELLTLAVQEELYNRMNKSRYILES